MIIETKSYILNAEGIDEFSAYIKNSDNNKSVERGTLLRTSLLFEDKLLDYLEHFGEGNTFFFKTVRHLLSISFELIVPGESYNPDEDGKDAPLGDVLRRLGLDLVYSYSRGANHFKISYQTKEKIPFAIRLLIAAFAGMLLGLAGMALPPAFSENVNIVLTPIADTIFGLIKMASLPVIFLCTINGILSCGDVGTFGKIGKKAMFGYLFYMMVLLLVTVAGCLIFLNIQFSSANSGTGVAESLINTVFDIFPNNLLAPFANGDNIQVIIIAIIFGVGLLAMSERAERIISLLDQLRDLSSLVMQWICELMPIMIFILIAQNIWHKTELVEALSAWKAVVIILAVYFLAIVFNVFVVSRKKNLSVKAITRAILPVCLKGLATCSSMFAYTDMEKTLKKKLNTDAGFTDFALPLGLAFFQPNLILISGITMYFASISNIEISISWILTLLIVCYLSSIAAPPVSGGFVAIISMMFGSLGINPVYLGIASSLVMLLDYPNTGGRVGLLMLEIATMDNTKKSQINR